MTRFPRLCLLVAAALVGALVLAEADAQPPGGRRPGGPGGRRPGRFMGGFGGPGMMGGGLVGLLRSPDVQEELKLSDPQKEQLRELSQKLGEEMQALFGDRQDAEDLTPEQRRERFQANMEKMRKEAEKRAPEIQKQIAGILDKAQFKRLMQLQVQRQGIDALLRADIIQALGLTEDQQKEIKEIVEERNKKREEMGQQMRGLFEGGFRERSEEEREQLRAKMNELREKGEAANKESQKKAMAVLTAEQKAKLPDVMGAPFEFRRPEGRRGPGGGRPGEGRPGEGRRDEGRRDEGRRGGERRGGERRGGDRPRRPQAG